MTKLPEGWVETSLGEAIDIYSGKTRPKQQGAYPVYGGNGILDYGDKFNQEGETIIVGRVGAYCGNVFYETQPFWLSDNALGAKAKKISCEKFLYYKLVSMKLNNHAIGGAQPLLTQTLLKELEIKLPSLPEQKAIADILSSFDEKIELLREQNKTLETLAQTIFKEWFVNFEFPHTPKAPPRQAPPATPPKEGNNSPPLEGCPKGGVVVTQNNSIPINNEQQSQQPPKKRNLRDTKAFMSLPYNPELKARARELRKAGNLAEVLFWLQVKKHQFHELDFDRQKIIGNYIVDFYCASLRLVVEIDGGSHNDKQEYDKKRDDFLEGLGLTVIHVLDRDVRNHIQAVMGYLEKRVVFCGDEGGTQNHHPALRAPLQGRGIGYKSAGGEMVESELGEIPKGWRVENIDKLVKLIIDHRGKTPKKLGLDWLTTGIPALSAKTIKNGKIVRRDAMNFGSEELYEIWMKDELEKKDILLTSEAPLGEMYYLSDNTKYILSQRLFALRVNNKIRAEYLYHYLFSPIGQNLLNSRASGSTVEGIRQSELRRVEVIIPAKEALNEASDIFASMFDKTHLNDKQIQNLIKARDTLLPKLMSGEIRVKEF